MLEGVVPDPRRARAIEQYLILTIDHGFNASTFTARVVTSTGADVGQRGGGRARRSLWSAARRRAQSSASTPSTRSGLPIGPEAWVRDAVANGDRIMGFGHAVYRTADPRSVMLRGIAQDLGGPLVDFAVEVEATVERLLAELKPGRELHTNVEFYAGVVMELCGLPRPLFTPTFAASRTIGWCAQILEQSADTCDHPPECAVRRASRAGAGPSARLTSRTVSVRRA